MKDGNAEGGYQKLDKLGWIKEMDNNARYEAIASDVADCQHRFKNRAKRPI